jgi:hypothetical protein
MNARRGAEARVPKIAEPAAFGVAPESPAAAQSSPAFEARSALFAAGEPILRFS